MPMTTTTFERSYIDRAVHCEAEDDLPGTGNLGGLSVPWSMSCQLDGLLSVTTDRRVISRKIDFIDLWNVTTAKRVYDIHRPSSINVFGFFWWDVKPYSINQSMTYIVSCTHLTRALLSHSRSCRSSHLHSVSAMLCVITRSLVVIMIDNRATVSAA